jgi:hypothetical protein
MSKCCQGRNRFATGIKALVILNVIDCLVTLTLVGTKIATEKNPLMSYLLDKGPLAFGAVKLGVTAIAAYGFWKIRKSPSAWVTLGVLLGIYTVLIVYQMVIVALVVKTCLE